LEVRKIYFRSTCNPVEIELDGAVFPFNIKKKSFWTSGCGELIGAPLRNWIVKTGLKSGDRVWLQVVKRYQLFKAVPQ